MRQTIATFTVIAVLLALAACAKATPTPTPTPSPTPSPTPVPSPTAMASGPVVVPVGRQVEHDGITIGVTEAVLTGEETVIKFWQDCGTHEPLEGLGSPELLVDGSTLLRGQGGGGKGCDPSEIKEYRFPPIPTDGKELFIQFGPFWGLEAGDLVLDLPIGSYLSGLDSGSSGKVSMDMVVESQGRAYRFTELSAGAHSFSIRYEPANDDTRWLPLTGPLTGITIEDDRGNEFTRQGAASSWDKEAGHAVKWEDIDFSGAIDRTASVWTLRVSNPGKIYGGPWEFRIELPYPRDLVMATATPTPTRRPTATPTPAGTRTPMPGETPVRPLPSEPRLARALGMLPLAFADRAVEFADYAGSMAALGIDWVHSTEDIAKIDRDIMPRLYEGLSILPAGLGSYAGILGEKLGLDLLAFDMGTWAILEPLKVFSVAVLEGGFDRTQVAYNLLSFDYKREEHNGTAYYWLNEDFRSDVRHPLLLVGGILNRVAFVQDRALMAPATDMVEAMIDVQYGRVPSLLDSEAHKALAETAGRGMIGAAILNPEWVNSTWAGADDEAKRLLDRYMEGPDAWGTLSPYEQALLGYRIRDGVEETVVALYYPDPDAAAMDAAELEKRWRTFHYVTGASGAEDVVAISEVCPGFATGTIALPDASILMGTCSVTRPDDRRPRMWEGPNLWVQLFEMRQVHFLAPDLETLKEAGSQQ